MIVQSLKILLVEDNEGDVILFQEYLKTEGENNISIKVANSLSIAKAKLQKQSYDLILLDLNLPDSYGIDTLEEIIRNRGKAGVVLLTGVEDKQLGMEAINMGAQDYLVKNQVTPELLHRTIYYAVSRNQDQLKLRHLQKVLQATRSINQLITRVENTFELIKESCEIFVGSEGYYTAWIILTSGDEIIQRAQKGISQQNFDTFCENFRKKTYSDCLKQASLTSDFVVTHSRDVNCINCSIYDGCKEVKSFVRQLKHKNSSLGFMGVTIDNKYADNVDEISLFKEVTGDIAFSVFTINEQFEKERINKNYLKEQKKLQTLVNNLPGITLRCKYDRKRTMDYLSEGCISMLGYNNTDIINNNLLPFIQLIHPKDRLRVKDEIAEMCKNQRRYAVEYRILTKDKKEIWVSEFGSPDFNSKNEITHLDGYISEITANKIALLQLEKSEEEYRLLAENSIDCIWKMDKRLNFMYASPAIKNLMGYDPEEVLGQPLYKFTKWKCFVKMARLALRTIENPSDYPYVTFETTIISKSGNDVPVEITGRAMVDKNNILIGVQGSTKNITERLRNQLALQKSEQKFRALYNNSPDMFVSVLPETGEVLLCNKTLLNSLGYISDEVIGKSIFSLYHQESLPEAQNAFKEYVKLGSLKNKELQLKSKDGARIDVSLNMNTIKDENDKVLYSIFSWRDITEKKKTEKLLMDKNQEILKQMHEYEALNEEYITLNEDLHESNNHLHHINEQLIKAKELAEENENLKSIFMANMSHEIRTPMNAIIGFSNFLMDDNLKHYKKAEFIKHINIAGQRLLKVINDIVDISKIEANQLNISLEDFNLSTVFNESYDFFVQSEMFSRKPDLHLVPKIRPEWLDLHVEGDFNRLGQVLDNLISNAIKYSHKGFIEYGFEIKQYENKEWIQVYVKDTGIGIPDDKKGLIFERFRQVEELEYHEGSGLGLSIAKGLVDLMGGKIWFESEHGIGSTFYFTIPCLRSLKYNEPKLKSKSNGINLSSFKILIAEDEISSSVYLREIFKEVNADTYHVQNGQELMDCIGVINPDILLLDMDMPIKSGFQCLQELREQNLKSGVKIIAQTAYAMKEEKERCIREGCDEYISKPYTKEEILEKVFSVLELIS